MKTYFLTIRYRTLFDDEWSFTNKIIIAENVKVVINKIHEIYKNYKFIIDNIYSEQME